MAERELHSLAELKPFFFSLSCMTKIAETKSTHLKTTNRLYHFDSSWIKTLLYIVCRVLSRPSCPSFLSPCSITGELTDIYDDILPR